jgi:hypothetical protein
MSFGIEGAFRRDILGLLVTHYASPHTKFLTVPDYQKKLQAYGLRPSMSGKGNCYDNASVETFFKSLKAELIWRQSWPTRRQAEAAIFQYINGFYNTRRRHSYLALQLHFRLDVSAPCCSLMRSPPA